jgi:deoxyribodipyrimidine photo-lyase
MQSGTTGINTTRVYNPIKQAQDHDPKAIFVRRWLPHMRSVPEEWIFEPWKMPSSLQQTLNLRVGEEIPMPLVDLSAATRESKDKLHALRKDSDIKLGNQEVIKKHASRKGSPSHRKVVDLGSNSKQQQLGFDF